VIVDLSEHGLSCEEEVEVVGRYIPEEKRTYDHPGVSRDFEIEEINLENVDLLSVLPDDAFDLDCIVEEILDKYYTY
jgi:hypothetical protein